jgi:hypothetical protein
VACSFSDRLVAKKTVEMKIPEVTRAGRCCPVVERSFQGDLPVKEQSACQSKSRVPAGQRAERLPFSYVVYANALSRIDSLYRFCLKENILLFPKTT